MQLSEKIRKKTVHAINDYHMIEENDRIMVAVSGGKDSSILLLTLKDIQVRAKINFTIQPVILDQKQPGFDITAFARWVESIGFDLQVINEDTYSIVKEKVGEGKSYCGLCSRLRRGILYNYAREFGFSKIALGHHRDDLNETLLLNLFFNGRMASMPPKLKSDDKRNVIIRPLAYVAEDMLRAYADQLDFPIIPCNLCGSQEKLQRAKIKALLKKIETEHPRAGSSILSAQQNVKPSQLLDRELWSFSSF